MADASHGKWCIWPLTAVLCAAQAGCSGAAPVSATDFPPVPVTPVQPVSEQYPGRTVEDPYRWLEGLSPENEWVEQQDRRARRWLSRLPARTEVRDLLQEFQSMPRLQLLDQYGDQVYFFHDRGASNQVDLYRAPARVFHTWSCPGAARCDRLPPDAEPVLLAGDREEGSRLRAVSISPDGNAVAWAEQSGDRLQWSWKPAGAAITPRGWPRSPGGLSFESRIDH